MQYLSHKTTYCVKSVQCVEILLLLVVVFKVCIQLIKCLCFVLLCKVSVDV